MTMPFPDEVHPELRSFITNRGTAVQKEWLRLHDAAKPRGLRERLNPEAHRARLKREGLESWYRLPEEKMRWN